MQSKAVVLGAGLSGLAVASRLSPATSCVVLEARGRVGGWVDSSRRADGHLFEFGPHSLRVASTSKNAMAVMDLISRLKLTPVHASSDAKKRLIWVENALQEIPTTLTGILRNPLTRSLPLQVVKDVLNLTKPPVKDETVYEFALRKFGPNAANVRGRCYQVVLGSGFQRLG